jgi:DNA-binding response OmpR family regulator
MDLKILAIDDDPALTEMTVLLLGSFGMQVLTANDGEQGVQLARAEAPHLVILDMMMPGMDGWQVCKAIRAFSPVPILAYSALNTKQEIASVLEVGANAYLAKPAPLDVLLEQIAKLTSSQ